MVSHRRVPARRSAVMDMKPAVALLAMEMRLQGFAAWVERTADDRSRPWGAGRVQRDHHDRDENTHSLRWPMRHGATVPILPQIPRLVAHESARIVAKRCRNFPLASLNDGAWRSLGAGAMAKSEQTKSGAKGRRLQGAGAASARGSTPRIAFKSKKERPASKGRVHKAGRATEQRAFAARSTALRRRVAASRRRRGIRRDGSHVDI